MVPTVALPPVTPFTCQVTAVFVVPLTLELNCWLAPAATLELVGVMDTVTVFPGGKIFTTALAD